MKVDLQAVDRTQFYVNEHVLNGELVSLVIPQQIGAKWDKDNKVFRSSVWDSNGELISAGLPKFTNWGENPEVFPLPTSLNGATIVEKIDGSLLIVSKWKGQFILRTRGTIDAHQLDNGHELAIFEQTILPKLSANDTAETWDYSYLFEWVSPLQKIVLNYGDQPDWYLVGGVNHKRYDIWEQRFLDAYAHKWSMKRPTHYNFPTIEELLKNVELWQGKEGVCVYSNGGQSIHKIKALDYLIKHRFKSEATLENTLEIFFKYGQPAFQSFEEKLIQQFDYECYGMVRGYASSICDASKQVDQIVKGITSFVNPLKSLPRKDAAQAILSSYGTSGRSNMAFTLLDNKPLSTDQQKKLYWQVLKK